MIAKNTVKRKQPTLSYSERLLQSKGQIQTQTNNSGRLQKEVKTMTYNAPPDGQVSEYDQEILITHCRSTHGNMRTRYKTLTFHYSKNTIQRKQ